MIFTGSLIIFLSLLGIIFQDLKYRSIHIALIGGLVVGSIFTNLGSWLNNLIYNLIFITTNTIGLFIFYSIKLKRFTNPIDQFLGLGDVLFFLAITPLFSIHSYLFFFLSGLIFSLLIHVMLNHKQINHKTIPLAGYLSIYLISYILIDYLTILDLFNLNYLL